MEVSKFDPFLKCSNTRPTALNIHIYIIYTIYILYIYHPPLQKEKVLPTTTTTKAHKLTTVDKLAIAILYLEH